MNDGSSRPKHWITSERVTAVAAIAAVVAAFLAWSVAKDALSTAKGGLTTAKEALSTAKKQLFRANRAWVAPIRATLDWDRGEFAVGKPLHLIIHHRNTGREPATGFVAQQTIRSFPHPGQRSWYSTFTEDRIKGICKNTNAAEGGGVVYPSDKPINQYRLTVRRGMKQFATKYGTGIKHPVTDKIMKGEHVLYIEGCFAYFTLGEEHKSAYCFMLIPKPNAPPKSWSFAFCPRGNKAD